VSSSAARPPTATFCHSCRSLAFASAGDDVAVAALLEDAAPRIAAQRLAQEIAAMPTPADVVGALA
jgi:hypothetical protein